MLDTGAAATTLTPKLIKKIGYTARDGYKKSRVQTAIGAEYGYWLHVAEFNVLGVSTPDFALAVFQLAYDDIDGLVGMNFLRHLYFEVRPAERQVLVELIDPLKAA